MKLFWIAVALAVVVAILAIGLSVRPHKGWEPNVGQRLAVPAAGGILVAVVWSIGFRAQLVRRRISLFSLFVLVAMEAAWFAAKQIYNP